MIIYRLAIWHWVINSTKLP